ncbi:Hsp33 family molecular chaperone HslO [Saccharophagus degradans]|uniref:Hsp33 family molecular chaperone HslO n=1 Tax=Saccharophagus degradans TaxID=86304 RepID=UPI001C0A34EF|nr:Hsp33 family molecular chaperone HslO [Saccharophagus degradans]MBU2985013.1 Hsp33 family molecular chaperone HslO [Saccharophagus degradans]
MQQNNDQIQRFIFDATDIRGEIVTLDQSFLAATNHQHLSPWCKSLLGEFLAAVSLLSETLKFNGLLTLQARGDGDIPLIMAETDNLGHVRGIIKPAASAPLETLDLGDAALPDIIGNGVLVMTIDPKIGERYQGIVPLENGTLAECLSDYFERSEQLATKFLLFSSPEKCAGMLLQALPAQKVKDQAEREDKWNTVVQLAKTVKQEELFELDHATLLYRLFNELECRLFAGKTIQFKCGCSRKRCANAITSLGKQDALELIEQQQKIDINCEFCGTNYTFKRKDIDTLFGEDNQPLH